MGKFTALNDPSIDQIVATHMQHIVTAIRANMEPKAILLRGSFGRGEGSVLVDADRLNFLSDYEINVVTPYPIYRPLFKRLSQKITAELGVDTSLAWIRPDYFYKRRVGPFTLGKAPINISRYETRYGSQLIYGNDFLHTAPSINVDQISLFYGIQLVLNRMAESLFYMLASDETPEGELRSIFWINKLILSCIESLLLSWGQYHFSYHERGQRFSRLSKERLIFMEDKGARLTELAERAIEFKLRPRRDLYPATLANNWAEVIPICEQVLYHLVSQEWEFEIHNNNEYADHYLLRAASEFRSYTPSIMLGLKLLDIYKYLRKKSLPVSLLSPYITGQIVYAVVPILFSGRVLQDDALPPQLNRVKNQLRKIGPFPVSALRPRDEWSQLSEHVFLAWKNFCA